MTLWEKVRLLAKVIIRKKTPIAFGDLERVEPISREFGADRGTPIDRYYIDSFLRDNQHLIRGTVLEVAELRYVKRFGHDVTRACIITSDAQRSPAKELCDMVYNADLTCQETLPYHEFHCFVCTQTLNVIYDVSAAIKGARYLLKRDGVFLGTVASYGKISRYDADRWGDYWRFSEASIQRLLSDVFDCEANVRQYGNALAAQAFLQGIAVEDLPNSALLDIVDRDYPVLLGFMIKNA